MQTIIFDWKQTLYNPEKKKLVEGAKDLLDFLKQQNIRLVLIGKGSQAMYDEVERLMVKDYFSDILFRDKPKDTAQFKPFVGKDPKQTYVIGDRIKGEIIVGNELEATTIWVQQGKFADELPETDAEKPMFTVASLSDLQVLLTDLFHPDQIQVG